MSEEPRSSRAIYITMIATAGVAAALTMSIIAIAQTGDRTPSATGYAMPMQSSRAAAAPAPQTANVLISHVIHGCHAMSVNGQMPMTPNATIRMTPGSTMHITDNDVMPHTLVQTGGPGVIMSGAAMRHMGAHSSVVFSKPGTYTFSTKAGEDYPNMNAPETIGADNHLRIRVVVTS